MSDRERQKLMNELCHMCSRHCVIPNSMRIPDCSNDATEVHYWEGLRSLSKSTYAGYQMAIKDVNVRTVDLGTFRSVSVPLLSSPSSHVRMHHRVFAERWWPGSTFGIRTSYRCLG